MGPDKQHWFPIVLQKSVPYEYPATSTHAHRPLRRLLPPIFVKRPAAWTSAGEIEHYLTITPCYHLTILATAGLQTQPVMSLHFPLSRCWSWKYFLGGMWIIHFFPWQHIHSWGLFCTIHNVTIGRILIVIIFFFLTTLCGTDGSPAYSPLLGLPSPGPDGRHPTNKRTHISFLNHISLAIHLYTCCTLCFWLRIQKKVVKL